MAITSKTHAQIKNGGHLSKNWDNKGIISASDDRFGREDWGEINATFEVAILCALGDAQ